MVLGHRSPQFQRGDSGRETVSLIRPPRQPIDDELSRRVGSSTTSTVLRQLHTAWWNVNVLLGWAVAAIAAIIMLILLVVVARTSDARDAVYIPPIAQKIYDNMTPCANMTAAASYARDLPARRFATAADGAPWKEASDAARSRNRTFDGLTDVLGARRPRFDRGGRGLRLRVVYVRGLAPMVRLTLTVHCSCGRVATPHAQPVSIMSRPLPGTQRWL